jgi:hypothetical protein
MLITTLNTCCRVTITIHWYQTLRCLPIAGGDSAAAAGAAAGPGGAPPRAARPQRQAHHRQGRGTWQLWCGDPPVRAVRPDAKFSTGLLISRRLTCAPIYGGLLMTVSFKCDRVASNAQAAFQALCLIRKASLDNALHGQGVICTEVLGAVLPKPTAQSRAGCRGAARRA